VILLHGLHPLPSPPKAASGAQEQPSKQQSNAFTRHIPSSTMAIAAPAPIPNPIPDPIAGNSDMPESTASMPPTSHNMWRSISTNLVMPVEFESMMLPCSDSWRSIAGNLTMPAEFANMLPPSGNICLQCYGDLPSARTRGRATAPSASIVVTAAPSPDAPLAPIVAAADSSSAPTMCNIV
jgi:hypothetical protein